MGGYSRDLLIVLILTLITLLFVFLPGLESNPLRVVFGLPFVLFLPGYSLIAALFPRKDDLDGIERIALSFGLSIAVVPLIGLILNYTPFGIRLVPIAISLTIFTIGLCIVAEMRRRSLAPGDRFSVSFNLVNVIKFESENRVDKALSILLALSIASAVFALIYVIATPRQGERFTEFYILGSEGKAAGYPSSLVFGESAVLRVGVVNQEYENINYTLMVVLDNTTLSSKSLSLSHNASWEEDILFIPSVSGDDLKLEFLLFKNDSNNPYRSLHLWVDIG